MERTTKPVARAAGLKNWLTALLCILLALLSVCLLALSYMKKNEARVLLGQCKTIELAVMAVGTQRRAAGEPFYDAKSASGLAEGCEAEVLALADCAGTLTLQEWDSTSETPLKMTYAERDFIAVFEGGESAGWSIYRLEELFLNE